MQTLYMNLDLAGQDEIELRYYLENPHQSQTRILPVNEIADLMKLAERKYYTAKPKDYANTGRKLYRWLDGSDRWLSSILARFRGETVVLAMAPAGKMAHLPWEMLHDANTFLVKRLGAPVVPVRWVPEVGAIPSSVLQEAALRATVSQFSYFENGFGIAENTQIPNRDLRVLFMASSPLDVLPVLDLKTEEGLFLSAIKAQPLGLRIEDSGCLNELADLVESYDGDYFDILHLTGYVSWKDGQSRFLTETETGESSPASAEDIAEALLFYWPPLIFLSGCRTRPGTEDTAVPLMAKNLLHLGATAILGWGRPVEETNAIAAPAILYSSLSAGEEVAEALAVTYRWLIEKEVKDWHLLRLYVAGAVPGALVTRPKTPKRKPAPLPSTATRFLDSKSTVKVPCASAFVGRRRSLERCLSSLEPFSEEVGAIFLGMAGIGKSSLAARLCDRCHDRLPLVWVGQIDEAGLISRLVATWDNPEVRQVLQNRSEPLSSRLKQAFRYTEELHTTDPSSKTGKSWLFVFDSFEKGNLEQQDESLAIAPKAAAVLDALVGAIRDTGAFHRIIITCQHDFDWWGRMYFRLERLEPLQGADWQKKWTRLASFQPRSRVQLKLQQEAKTFADGNPRLIEWFDKLLQNQYLDACKIMDKLGSDKNEFPIYRLAEELLLLQPPELREILALGLLYELPVPQDAIVALAPHIPNPESYLRRALAVGLLETSEPLASKTSHAGETKEGLLWVPRMLTPLLEFSGTIGEYLWTTPGSEGYEALHRKAARILHNLWYEHGGVPTEEQQLEIHRLALRGKSFNIAVKIAENLVNRWKHQGRFFQAVEICQATLEVVDDRRIFHRLAASLKQLGDFEGARNYYQKALAFCPDEDAKEKASILHNLAVIKASQGQIMGAIRLYEKSLLLKEDIGNLQGKAATLHQLATLKAGLGDVDEAIDLYEQSLALKDRMGNVSGKAPTLAMLGQLLAERREDFETALVYLQESLKILNKLRSPEAVKVQDMIAKIHSSTSSAKTRV